ncbi:MAG: NAD(P)-dependent oxidoreductase [Actinobacteria bacterium]|nr:NAD(P)-dependent oxidoreductase [Actinomycetota bacterium]
METTDVTMIGLGNMGSCLARTFLESGLRVTVWNRTAAKAEPLTGQGAQVAATAAEAIGASPLTVMNVLNYEGANEILALDGVDAALAGRTFANLSTGSVEESERQGEWVTAQGGVYLDGGILAYPRDIGGEDTVIIYSGPEDAFEAHREVLAKVAGSQRLVGDGAAATVVYLALWSYYFSALGGFYEAAAFVDAAGVSIESFHGLVPNMTERMLGGIDDGARRIAADDYSGDQASVDIHVDGVSIVAAEIRKVGVSANLTEAFVEYCREAKAAGDGQNDIASIFKAIK